jgi:phosphoenolpyruvate---glycerone phosphotransferase subunit DhaL
VVRLGADAAVAFLERVRVRTERAQPELDRLDALAGDGDHGVTMVLGWRAVCAALADADIGIATPGEVLRRAAAAFANVGGSAGPLWGTALLRAGRALGDKRELDVASLATAAAAATQGMEERGRSAEGDRTVVDAMAPAALALADAARAGASMCDALCVASAAAAAGAAATANLVPRRGRAVRSPERVMGHEDAGARAAAVFWSSVGSSGTGGGAWPPHRRNVRCRAGLGA